MDTERQLKLEGLEGTYRKVCQECGLIITGTGAEHKQRVGHQPTIWHDSRKWFYRKVSDTFKTSDAIVEMKG